jgi:hypothetical protein
MVTGLASQIDPKKELTFWTTLIIVLLKEQSTVYIKADNFLQTFGIPEISPTFYPFYKKCKI